MMAWSALRCGEAGWQENAAGGDCGDAAEGGLEEIAAREGEGGVAVWAGGRHGKVSVKN